MDEEPHKCGVVDRIDALTPLDERAVGEHNPEYECVLVVVRLSTAEGWALDDWEPVVDERGIEFFELAGGEHHLMNGKVSTPRAAMATALNATPSTEVRTHREAVLGAINNEVHRADTLFTEACGRASVGVQPQSSHLALGIAQRTSKEGELGDIQV